jgi:hypothetical protein
MTVLKKDLVQSKITIATHVQNFIHGDATHRTSHDLIVINKTVNSINFN